MSWDIIQIKLKTNIIYKIYFAFRYNISTALLYIPYKGLDLANIFFYKYIVYMYKFNSFFFSFNGTQILLLVVCLDKKLKLGLKKKKKKSQPYPVCEKIN